MKSKFPYYLGFFLLGIISLGFSHIALAQEGSPQKSSSIINAEKLVGTWQHVSTSKTPDGPTKAMENDISWTFKANGTGTYRQKIAAFKMDNSRSFAWALEGSDIQLKNIGSEKVISTYTVIKFSPSEMTWKNNTLGDYYHVKKK